jgi:hypothetical protein
MKIEPKKKPVKPETKSVIERKAFNLKETAATLGLNLQTVRRLVKDKKLKTLRLTAKGKHLVAVNEIDRLLREGSQ